MRTKYINTKLWTLILNICIKLIHLCILFLYYTSIVMTDMGVEIKKLFVKNVEDLIQVLNTSKQQIVMHLIKNYKENIHYGCGLKKHTTTTFRVPLTNSKGADWWSVYLFDRFKANGGDKVLTDGTHLFKIEMRR